MQIVLYMRWGTQYTSPVNAILSLSSTAKSNGLPLKIHVLKSMYSKGYRKLCFFHILRLWQTRLSEATPVKVY
jgi:hypothetical protein